MSDTPDILYHYCSLETFFNIIKNKSIWLSDVLKSNDSNELKWYYMKLLDWLDKNHTKVEITEEEYQISRDNLLKLRENPNENTWALCLSEEGDLLSQWRGYADDGRGVSIGFDFSYLNDFNSHIILNGNLSAAVILDKIRYEDKDINVTASHQIALLRIIEEEYGGVPDVHPYIIGDSPLSSPFFKSSSFCEEKEWRIAISLLGKSEYPQCGDNYMQYFDGTNNEADWCKFGYIVSNGKLVSHFEISISDIKEAIKEIVIGPKCQETIESIKLFMFSLGIIESPDDNSITVRDSTSSYR